MSRKASCKGPVQLVPFNRSEAEVLKQFGRLLWFKSIETASKWFEYQTTQPPPSLWSFEDTWWVRDKHGFEDIWAR